MPEPARILAVLKQQHEAIDQLMARMIMLDPKFLPSKSGAVWDALVAGGVLIREMEA